ncbi:MAG: response regulator [Planctomycetaceae bacterium]
MTFQWPNGDTHRSGDDAFFSVPHDLPQAAEPDWDESLDGNESADACDDVMDAWLEGELDEEPREDIDAETVAPTAEEISSLMAKLTSRPSANAPSLANSKSASAAPESALPLAARGGLMQSSVSATTSVAAESLGASPGIDASQDLATSISIGTLDPELRDAFLDDARSCVSAMEAALLRLESDPQHADSLNQIGRELHTLKGASASVGLTDLADQLHRLEDTLHADQVAGRVPCFDSLLMSVDAIRSQISGCTSSPDVQTATVAESLPVVSTAAGSRRAATAMPSFDDDASDDESVRVKSSQLNRLMDMLAELVMLRNRRETELGELQEVYHELIGSVSKMRLLCSEGQQVKTCSSLQLSEIANDVLEVAQNVRDCARPVAEGNTAVSQFIRQFRQELVELRRTPVAGLFQRLQRVVRDAAQAESKSVQLKLIGENAGIERSLQQRLYEPLLHIVRNAVCHGIEAADIRVRNGKDPVGTITLEAKSGPDMFVIEIRDDGNGLDYDAIRRKGIEAGLLAACQSPSRHELSQLIFHPGFSTRQTANQAAGRGVGMDVVASTLHRMRGWLDIESEPQRGTRIRLSFPLPSVIQHAMVFRCGDQLFALPMQAVHSIGEASKSQTWLSFAELLGDRPAPALDSCQKIVLACESPVSSAATGSRNVTLLVDEVIGPEEVVVRPLPTLLKPHPFCSGATLSGMGKTVILLDARRLVESQIHLLRSSDAPCETVSAASDRESTPLTSRPRVLVVDDSISARKRSVRSLRRYSVEIVEAGDGKEALELLKSQSFAAVFSDMEMPHVSGMELLAEINSIHHPQRPSVVIISSRSEPEFTERAAELGATSYLIKPLTDEALDEAAAKIPQLTMLHD